jgi:hypothetical protein
MLFINESYITTDVIVTVSRNAAEVVNIATEIDLSTDYSVE